MKKNKDNKLQWKVAVPELFTEIVNSNSSMWIMKHPLTIADNILREGAKRAIEIKDEQMIAIFARLGMYEGCTDKSHPDHEKLMALTNKKF